MSSDPTTSRVEARRLAIDKGVCVVLGSGRRANVVHCIRHHRDGGVAPTAKTRSLRDDHDRTKPLLNQRGAEAIRRQAAAIRLMDPGKTRVNAVLREQER